jgi:hypothetical protein
MSRETLQDIRAAMTGPKVCRRSAERNSGRVLLPVFNASIGSQEGQGNGGDFEEKRHRRHGAGCVTMALRNFEKNWPSLATHDALLDN